MRCGRPGRRGRVVTVATNELLSTRAIVGEEEEDRVVECAHGLDLADQLADFSIHARDHGGMDCHFQTLEAPLLGSQTGPWDCSVHLAGSGFCDKVWLGGIPRWPNVRL